MDSFEKLVAEVKACRLCDAFLPLGARPVFSIHPKSKILVIGQAPCAKVYKTGIPWNDPSGDELRRWLGVDRDVFYNPEIFGIMPMGFYYPGKGKGGDMPPRPECAPTWHAKMRVQIPEVQLILLIGQYAQKYYLGAIRKRALTDTVMTFEEYQSDFFPLVHPSPRNRMWQRRNPWFEDAVIPALRERVQKLIQ